MWKQLFTESSYYFDEPTLDQEIKMKKTLQGKYDSLFKEGWRPPLQSRKDLVEWVCFQHRSFNMEKGGPEIPESMC